MDSGDHHNSHLDCLWAMLVLVEEKSINAHVKLNRPDIEEQELELNNIP